MDVLAPYLIGAATTLIVQAVIQFYVVPRVETRKRREDRWERNVLELGELLTSLVDQRAHEVRLEQSLFRAMSQQDISGPEFDQAKVARGMAERATNTQQLTWAFIGLVRTRVYWLAERVMAFKPAAEATTNFQIAAMRYLVQAEGIAGWSKDDDRNDASFEEGWQAESDARYELITQTKLLADMQHPPRTSLPRQLRLRWRRMRGLGRS